MDADRPIKTVAEDRLGFAPVAQHLAKVILDQSAKDGLVFGIEGEWGSGKSTLINLAISALRNASPAPEIIEYSPWLVGSRDDLLTDLFDELAGASSKIDPVETENSPSDRTWRDWLNRLRGNAHSRLRRKERLKRELSGKLKTFGALAGGLSKVIKSSELLGLPYAQSASTVVGHLGKIANGLFASDTIAKRKAEIVEALQLLSRRIVVFVDDLDRLEPREASEVLRLIRAVADFPNIIYVLSYDVDVVSKTLQSAIQVDDGHAFLEKIVQVSFKVPRPEASDLRRWFQDEVRKLFGDEIANASNLQEPLAQRLALAIDVYGGRYLKTPRDVVRALNSLRLHAIPVRAEIDLADMVWLQLVRIGNSTFYDWIEEYLTETSAVYRGANVSDDVAVHTGQRLEDILAAEHLDVIRARIDSSTILPGVLRGAARKDEDSKRVFNNLNRETFNRFIVERRLGSPEHYRYYFAFAQPAGALSDRKVATFIQQAQEDREGAIKMFQEFGREVRPQGGVMAELMIERLLAIVEQIPHSAIPNILSALSEILDDAALSTRDGDWGQHRSWGVAEQLVMRMLSNVTDASIRSDSVDRLFKTGRAIGWQTSLLRGEIFAHGRFGDRKKPEAERLLTPIEFERASYYMIGRYEAMEPQQLRAVPNLISLLYGWEQAAGNDDAAKWVKANTKMDEDLLAFLSRARGWSSSSEGIRYPLKREDISKFLDYDLVVQRVQAIADTNEASPEKRKLATDLLTALRQGQKY